jgi:hypothetical protein
MDAVVEGAVVPSVFGKDAREEKTAVHRGIKDLPPLVARALDLYHGKPLLPARAGFILDRS